MRFVEDSVSYKISITCNRPQQATEGIKSVSLAVSPLDWFGPFDAVEKVLRFAVCRIVVCDVIGR